MRPSARSITSAAGAEREAHVAAEARAVAAPPLARVHVEELAGHGDDLVLERGAEEAHAVVERRRQLGDVAPDVEGAVGRAVDAYAEPLEPRRACGRASRGTPSWMARVSLTTWSSLEQRNGRALQRLASRRRRGSEPALEASASTTLLGPDGPGDAPAGVAPVLGEPVEEHDRIAVDVLDVARRALHRQRPGRAAIDVVRVELVERAARSRARARVATQRCELLALDQLARRVARVATGAAPRGRGRGSRAADRRRRRRSRARPRAGWGWR